MCSIRCHSFGARTFTNTKANLEEERCHLRQRLCTRFSSSHSASTLALQNVRKRISESKTGVREILFKHARNGSRSIAATPPTPRRRKTETRQGTITRAHCD